MTEQNRPICKTQSCKRPLTWIDKPKGGCWRCLVCNPLPKKVEPTPEKERKYLDVQMTEERVREIVRDELMDWHIQKPSLTKTEVAEAVGTVDAKPVEIKAEPTWREQAKRLGIPLTKETGGARKKEDVLAEIAAGATTESPKGDNNDSPATAEKGA